MSIEQKKEFDRTYRFHSPNSTFRAVVGDPANGQGGIEVAAVVRRVERKSMIAIRSTIDGNESTICMPAHDAKHLADELIRWIVAIDPDYAG